MDISMEEEAHNKRKQVNEKPSAISNATKDREFQSPVPKGLPQNKASSV